VPPRDRRDGLVVLHTGDGKGKTTAALGILLRASGREMKVAMLQLEHVAARRLGGEYDVVILDELTYPLAYGWLTHEEVFDALRHRPPGTHVVITGRLATPELIGFADLVTEMREVKHPYRERGLGAQPGIEL
jgi:cob(I)alamin adenosyltransferase